MTCERARELFSEYLEGAADHAVTTALRGHMDKCLSCQQQFELFRKTWHILGTLPETKPPSDLRHEIVMRVAREQHDHRQVTQNAFSTVGKYLSFARLFPARTLAIACVAAAVAIVLLRVPESAYDYFTGKLYPDAGIIEPTGTGVDRDQMQPPPLSKLESELKSEWQSRKVKRNSVWITIEPTENQDNTALYRVNLSINNRALLQDEYTARIGAKVLLLPPGQISASSIGSARVVWQGNILKDSPVMVPVIVNRSQERPTTVNLLVVWSFRQRELSRFVFIPTQRPRSFAGSALGFSSEGSRFTQPSTDIYSTLRGIARNYGVPIVVRSGLDVQPTVTDLGGAMLDDALRETLKPVGLEWMHSDGAVYIETKPLVGSTD